MVDELHNEDAIETQEKEETMEEMMQQYDVMGDFHRGKVVEGTIVDTQEDGWLVDVGYKCEGFLPRKEWTHRVLVEETPEPQNGDKVRVQITNINQGEDAQLGLSRWRCEFDERWNKLEEEAENNETINVKGLRKVKGGLIVNCCGIEGFIPISHLTQEGRGVNPGNLVGQEFPVKLIEKDRRKRRLVFSRRSLIEEELSKTRQASTSRSTRATSLRATSAASLPSAFSSTSVPWKGSSTSASSRGSATPRPKTSWPRATM